MNYDSFKPIVDIVLSNWTALQLAVDHGMGNPGGIKAACSMTANVANYCVAPGIPDVNDLSDLLEDIMYNDFETICEDNSPIEVATILIDFVTLLRNGFVEELWKRIDAMPKCQKWLSTPIPVGPQNLVLDDETFSSSEDETKVCHISNSKVPEPMDEDGWTVVKGRGKKN